MEARAGAGKRRRDFHAAAGGKLAVEIAVLSGKSRQRAVFVGLSAGHIADGPAQVLVFQGVEDAAGQFCSHHLGPCASRPFPHERVTVQAGDDRLELDRVVVADDGIGADGQVTATTHAPQVRPFGIEANAGTAVFDRGQPTGGVLVVRAGTIAP